MKVDYGGIMLNPSDALYGHQLDAAREYRTRWSPMREFDPSDVVRLGVQDAICESGDGIPDIFANWYLDIQQGVTDPRWRGTDEEFAAYAMAMRNALLLPLCQQFHDAIDDLWEAWGVPEAQRRIADQERRARQGQRQTSDWETADLVAEVESICGAGRKSGRQIAFTCPWHDDSDPSLTVDPVKRTWFCWPCRKGGGVVAWRRANGQ